jgi:hypothetical protein
VHRARAVSGVALWVALGLGLGGCGDDVGPTTPPPDPARPRGPVSPTGPKPPQLTEKVHIEDRVTCPIPGQPSDPQGGKCDLKAPSCAEHLYCLPLAQGSYCEPCAERDGIRHAFKERDFAVDHHNRDPFQSFLLSIDRDPRTPIDLTPKCPHKDQMVATSYSYADLKLVGIVAQGTLHKALMMGGPLGHIIKRGDCVGKEKAVVKGKALVSFDLFSDSGIAWNRAPSRSTGHALAPGRAVATRRSARSFSNSASRVFISSFQ